jgi:hypothetical protein
VLLGVVMCTWNRVISAQVWGVADRGNEGGTQGREHEDPRVEEKEEETTVIVNCNKNLQARRSRERVAVVGDNYQTVPILRI